MTGAECVELVLALALQEWEDNVRPAVEACNPTAATDAQSMVNYILKSTGRDKGCGRGCLSPN